MFKVASHESNFGMVQLFISVKITTSFEYFFNLNVERRDHRGTSRAPEDVRNYA